MRADGDISRDDYLLKMEAYEQEIERLKRERDTAEFCREMRTRFKSMLRETKDTLKMSLDLDESELCDPMKEKLIENIVHTGPYRYNLYLRLNDSCYGEFGLEEHVLPYKVFHHNDSRQKKIIHCTKVFDHTVTLDRAMEYRERQGRGMKVKRWDDLQVSVYI